MTDITELAQSLKAAAENAIGAHERLAAYPYGEIIDISQHEGEQIDIDITDINEFHEEASPANVLALVEALEKAQGMEAYWKTQCRGITDHCEELQARIAELEREQEQLRPVGVMSEQAFHRLENRECRFIALWPHPGIFLQRKRPEDGVIVYARTAAAAGIKVEDE
ncbi:ead/Ea22-like family protein [Klebsiella quasipneumoniae]|uniref:ead/Ea22-like family protein n=1 Tax=Klebsiella quasipneumoniae TaxID=1463165 RepID=UPI001CD3DA28|nr:ead/Ea22-like family protein [Klebsiella quasipneumoniae]